MESELSSYFPAPECIKNGSVRKVYSYVPLDDDEIAAIEEFRIHTHDNNISVPDW